MQCEPPDDFAWFAGCRRPAPTTLGMHLEAVEPEVRARVMPGKARVPLAIYFAPSRPRSRVRPWQGEHVLDRRARRLREELRRDGRALTRSGVYPFVVPFVPLGGTRLASEPPPSSEFMQSLYREVGRAIRENGMSAEQIKAGCTKCGACSALSAYEKVPA